jgi:tetratricopeptide (TPR) repeat protein
MDDASVIAASSSWLAAPGMATAGRPLVTATLAANVAVNRLLGVDERMDPDGPNKAVGFRLFNLLLHLLTGALLFGVLRHAMRESSLPEEWRAVADPFAGIVCALWLLHPIQSEVINYIVQRSEGLASFFYLATLYSSQRAWQGTPSSRLRWYALAAMACVLGIASKEIVISAPLAVMLYDRAFRLPSWRALLRPGDGRGWFYIGLWAAVLGSFAALAVGARGDTAGFHTGMTWYAYLYTQCWAIAHYLSLTVWPSPLAIDYGSNLIRGARGVPGALILSAFGIATIAAWTRVRRWGWFAFAGSLFFLLLAPSSSVIPIAAEVAAERRIYLALAAVLVLGGVLAEWTRRRFAAHLSTRSLTVGVAALAGTLALCTAVRSRTYANPEALWREAVLAVPGNARALDNLGWTYYRQREPKFAQAESAFRAAISEDSTCHLGCVQLATVLVAQGRFADAQPLLERAVARDSGYLPAERDLGLVLMKQDQDANAIPHLEHVVSRKPTMDALVVLGVAYLSVGRRDDAVTTFRRTEYLEANNAQLQRFGRTLEAAAHDPTALPALRQLAWKLSRDWM